MTYPRNTDESLDDQTITADIVRAAERIKKAWRKGIEAIIETGKQLISYRDKWMKEQPGKWSRLIGANEWEGKSLLPFGKSHVYRLIKIAESEVLFPHVGILPNDTYTLYQLASLDSDLFQQLITDGTINPETQRADVRSILRKIGRANILTGAAAFSAEGPFGTVVIDPPWDMQRIDLDIRPELMPEFDYPTMDIEEIETFCIDVIIPKIEPDCHWFMWTTQKWLPDALTILEQIGFNYVLTMVWHKGGGFQPLNLPAYNCEFALYGRRGSPVFIDTSDFPCCFEGARREHSRKPDRFYEIVRRVTGGSRIDVFSREAREGFAQYGNEIGKFSEAAE